MLTDLAKYKIARIPRDKSKKFGKSRKKLTKTDTEKKFEVAIFPWRFKLPQWYADPSPSIDACLNGVFDIIQKFDEIDLKYSYYENKKFRLANVKSIKSLMENNEKNVFEYLKDMCNYFIFKGLYNKNISFDTLRESLEFRGINPTIFSQKLFIKAISKDLDDKNVNLSNNDSCSTSL